MSTHTVPPPALDPVLVEKFRKLNAEWYAATWYMSGPSARAEHPVFRTIVALGPAVVPVILAEMAANPGWWFAALRELTGENPVPDEHRGSLPLMAEDWVAWGRARGLV